MLFTRSVLGRAQQHYTVDDKVLMNRVWKADLRPVVREKLLQRGLIIGTTLPPSGPAAVQQGIASFFARSGAHTL